jgi:hypothetical protein
MAKSKRTKIRLNSTGSNEKGKSTGTFKTITKKMISGGKKLTKKCYDSRAWNTETKKKGMHVLFEEGKL